MDGETAARATADRQASGWRFRNGRTFAWKTILLAVATFAFAPILLYESILGVQVYLAALVAVHVVGLATFAWGVTRHDIAPTRRGFIGRIGGLLFAGVFLFIAEKGLRTETGSALFWWSLFGVWAAHTIGLLLLHLRSEAEDKACPFA